MDPSQKRKCKTPYDNVDITFKDILTGDIIYYSGLKSLHLFLDLEKINVKSHTCEIEILMNKIISQNI